ncbi:MAG: TolC family protein [Kiritimatiellia bacterium]
MRDRFSMRTLTGLLAAGILAGCATPDRRTLPPESKPIGVHVPTVDQRLPHRRPEAVPDAVPEPSGNIGLEQALAASLMRNPELQAFSYATRAAEARLLQAGVLPNPRIAFDIDEYDRGGEGFDSAETAVVLSQPFELGGKRRWRKQLAEAEGELAGWEYESKRLDIVAETARRFVQVLAARERLELARSAVELAEKTHLAVTEHVKAGKEAPQQASKSSAELEMARLDALGAENGLSIARNRLAAMWGAKQVLFDRVEGSLNQDHKAVPSLEMLRAKLGANPDMARWDAVLRLRRAEVAAAKAARIPELEASVGYLQYEEDETDAFAFGIGLPLPIFDQNRGNIAAAQHGLAESERERGAKELALSVELSESHAKLTAAHQRVGTLRTKVVPAMEQAFEAAREGYQQGKIGFLEMLDAQRGLFEARSALVEALFAYHAALIDIQRITATTNEVLNGEAPQN